MGNNFFRIGSILLALVVSSLILVFPQGVTDEAQQAQHSMLTLYMLAVMIAFIHGVGFSFKNRFWHYLIGPIVSWPVLIWATIAISMKVGFI